MVLFRGMAEDISINAWFNDYIWPMEANLTPEDVYWGAMLGFAECIESGVTSVADHYFNMDEVAQAVVDSGMRANLAWAVFAHGGMEMLDRTSRFVQDWQGKGDGRVTAWLGPHAPYTTTVEFMADCAERARELGAGIHIHVSENEEQVVQSLEKFGITPVRQIAEAGVLEVPTILAHCANPTDEDIAILAGKRTGVGHSPKTYLKLASDVVTISRLRNAGVPVGLATDGSASSNTLDILEQLRIMVLMQKRIEDDPTAMPVAEALDIAFRGSAQVLHMGDDLGSLEPGKLADLALLRQDGMHVTPRFNPAANLIYSARASDVDTTICNGKVLMHNRQLLTLDKAEIRRQVNERLERLSQRDPSRRIAFYPS
jgi:5-methylthioadenosine/S-adenosylhomocysteine deaminase